jgi:transposase InsO family protein
VACREAGISQQSYYRWRKEYGGLEIDQAKRTKDLERENCRWRSKKSRTLPRETCKPRAHPTAEWLARQITEAFPWASTPTYLVRDNDGAYGDVFSRRARAIGIRDRPILPRSPWQNGHIERLIGTLRRECLDRMLIFGEAHLRQILILYGSYYNESRTHLSLHKDTPLGRAPWTLVLDRGNERWREILWFTSMSGRAQRSNVTLTRARDTHRIIWSCRAVTSRTESR